MSNKTFQDRNTKAMFAAVMPLHIFLNKRALASF